MNRVKSRTGHQSATAGPARVATLAAAVVAVVTAAGLVAPQAPASAERTSAERAGGRTLAMSPPQGVYAGGSRLTLTGSLGVKGRRTVTVQRHMGRPGDVWWEVPGTTARTRRDGSFTVHAPASGMRGLRYRVTSGKRSTAAAPVDAVAQEVVLTPPTEVVPGQPMTFGVDTVASRFGTYYLDLPAVLLPGRTVTLQRRLGDESWQDLASTTTDGAGQAALTVPSGDGTGVYRAVAQDWRGGGDRIDAFPSYPVLVDPGAAAPHASTADTSAATSAATSARRASEVRVHAASTYRWGGSQGFDFDWEYGETLHTPSGRGSRPGGRWQDGSDGTGRAAPRNGGMLLSSDGYANQWGPGVHGSVWVTLGGQGQRLGRWEMRGQTTDRGGAGQRYGVRYELVPDGRSQRCGVQGIVLAEFASTDAPMRFGLRGPSGAVWGGSTTRADPTLAHSYAVQVTRKHVTWFLNGKPIGSVRTRSAVPTTALTPRVTLVGAPAVDGQAPEMRSGKTTVDWVRGYSLKAGKQPTTGRRLTAGAPHGGC